MLSYRHAFHAGNHADILKHTALTLVLENMLKKDKPFTLIDTHAGAGIYSLDDERALQTGETADGILKLMSSTLTTAEEGQDSLFLPQVPDSLKPYLSLVNLYIKENRYPGSPEIMRSFLRKEDRLLLMELHNNEIEVLKTNMKRGCLGLRNRDENQKYGGFDKRIGIHHRNAYEGLKALCPPTPRRGVLLMDPSYEIDEDYESVARSLVDCHKRWSVGIVMLWYPLLKHRETELAIMKSAIKDAAFLSKSEVLVRELLIDNPDKEMGLYGSGMLIVNPPWHLDEQLTEVISFIEPLLKIF